MVSLIQSCYNTHYAPIIQEFHPPFYYINIQKIAKKQEHKETKDKYLIQIFNIESLWQLILQYILMSPKKPLNFNQYYIVMLLQICASILTNRESHI